MNHSLSFTRIFIGFSFYCLVFAIVFLSGLETTLGYHTDGNDNDFDCFPFTGHSFKPSGTFNGGSFNFVDSYPDQSGCVNKQYETTLEPTLDTNPASPSDGYVMTPDKAVYDLDGWIWNTNVGWVSLRCVSGNNRDVPCGDIEYMSWVDQDGYLHGWWWGEGTGWIRLDWWCTDTGDVDGDGKTNEFAPAGYCSNPTDPDGGEPFITPDEKLVVVQAGQPAVRFEHGTAIGYVWSRELGWIYLQAENPVENPADPNVKVCDPAVPENCWHGAGLDVTVRLYTPNADGDYYKIKQDDGTFIDYSKIPYANKDFVTGNQLGQWILEVSVKDMAGNEINTGDPGYSFDIQPVFRTSTLYKDQIADTAQGYVDLTVNTIPPPDVPQDTWPDSVFRHSYQAYAPTSNVNGAQYNLSAGQVDKPFDLGQQHDLCLMDVQVQVSGPFDFDETYSFGGNANSNCDSNPVIDFESVFEHVYLGDGDFRFKPVAEITQLTSDGNDYIVAYRNTPFPIKAMAARLDLAFPENQISIGFEARNAAGGNQLGYVIDREGTQPVNFDFVDNIDDSNCHADASSAENAKYSLLFSNSPVNRSVLVNWQQDENCGDTSDLDKPEVASYIELGNVAKHWSRPLPLEGSSQVATANPVVKVEGLVSVSGAVSANQDAPVVSIGNVTYGVTRDEILKNVKGLTRGVTARGTSTFSISAGSFVSNNNTGKIAVGSGVAWYINGDLTISAGGADWTEETTFIVEGGNVKITSDLYSTSNTKLGIIVLRKPNDVIWKSGNFFVQTAVKDLQANIYADGAFMRYDANLPASTSNDPNLVPTFADRVKTLSHQLYITGSLSSANCIGCVDRDPKTNGYGGSTGVTLDVATAYDLNFLSYFRVYEYPQGSGNVQTWQGGLCSKQAGSDCGDLSDSKNASVYFVYNAPTSTLPGFSSKEAQGGSQLVR